MPAIGRTVGDQLDRTRDDFGYIISFIQAATLVRDDGLFHEFVFWLRRLLEASGVPAVTLARSLRALGDARPDDDVVVGLLADASGAVTA